MQLGPIPTATGGGFLKDALAARRFKRLGLQRIVLLIAFGYARVSEQGTLGFHKRPFVHGTTGQGNQPP
ncbi:MAG: hypothetical protein WB660_02740 [Candidatus Sulfotelmatobacter sp.]